MTDHRTNPRENAGPAPRLFLPAGADNGVPVDNGPTVRGTIAALRRKLWVVVLFAAIGVGLTAIALSRTERPFASRTVIQLPESGGSSPGGALAGLAATLGATGGSINAQAQVIRSRLLIGQVVDSLDLRLHREISGVIRSRYRPVGWIENVDLGAGIEGGVVQFRFDDSGADIQFDGETRRAELGERVDFPGLSFELAHHPGLGEEVELFVVSRRAAVDALLEDTRPLIRDGTNLIDIVVAGYDPWITQRVADITAGIYQEFTIGRAREQAERQNRFVQEQLSTTEEMLRQTQEELTDFRRREGLYSSRAQAMMDQTGRAELQVQQAELRAQRRVFETLMQRIRSGDPSARAEAFRTLAVSPSIAESPVIMSEYEALRTQQIQRDSLLTGRVALSRTSRDIQALDSLIAASETSLVGLVEGHLRSLDAQLAALEMIEERVDSTFQHLAATEPEEVRLMLRMEAIGEAANELRSRSYSAGILQAGLVEEVAVLDHALLGDLQGTGPIRSLLLGLILGTLVGAAGAVVLDSANQSIRERDEVERVLRISGLGVVPQIGRVGSVLPRLKLPAPIRSGEQTAGLNLVTATDVHSPGAEAYRSIRTNLAHTLALDGTTSIMVTSPSNGEGKTTTASNLAVAFAQQGRRVLLVDSDMRRAQIHKVFGLDASPGLSDLLLNGKGIQDVIQTSEIRGLDVVTAGKEFPVSAADLLSGEEARDRFSHLSSDYDIVIVDAPPVLLTADAPILASHLDGVLLVLRAGETERETAQYAIHQLAAVGANLVGAILNDPDGTLQGSPTYMGRSYTAV